MYSLRGHWIILDNNSTDCTLKYILNIKTIAGAKTGGTMINTILASAQTTGGTMINTILASAQTTGSPNNKVKMNIQKCILEVDGGYSYEDRGSG